MEFKVEKNRIYAEDANGKLIAEVTFPEDEEGVVTIDHTYVDDSLRGQGIAAKLLDAAAKEIEKQRCRAIPSCSYAVSWFEQNPDRCGILKE